MATTQNAFNPNDKKHLVVMQGQKYITFVGLQALLIDRGLTLVGTDSEVLKYPSQEGDGVAVVKATILVKHPGEDEPRPYRAIGDASAQSVGNAKLVPHIIRMAETRAYARAFRLATRAEFTAKEELPTN